MQIDLRYHQQIAVFAVIVSCTVCASCICNISVKPVVEYSSWMPYSECSLQQTVQNDGGALLFLVSRMDVNSSLMKSVLESSDISRIFAKHSLARFIADVGDESPQVHRIQDSLRERGFGAGIPMVLIYKHKHVSNPSVYLGIATPDRLMEFLREIEF